jgi:hypothetical protein
MLRISHLAAAATATLVALQPCAAADDLRGAAAAPQARPAAFAGVGIRLPLGRAGTGKPTARLQLAPAYRAASAGTGQRGPAGLELGLGRAGKPAFYIGGRPAAVPAGQRQSLGGSKTTTFVVIGGVVLLVLVLAAVASAAPTPGPQKGAFD